MGLERLKEPNKTGVSFDEENWIVESEIGFGMDQLWDRILDSVWISPGDEARFTVYVGDACQHNAAWYLNQALTGWSDWEERACEIFYEESLAEIEDPLSIEEKGLRPQFYHETERMCQEICAKLGIEINYYEITAVKKFEGLAYWPHERDEPKCSVAIFGHLYESD